MIDIVKDILGITGNQYDYFLLIICTWIVLYFMYLLFNLVASVVNRV